MTVKFYPINDGIDHINIYSKGRTELGRALSHFSLFQFAHHGMVFRSLEVYWYHLLLNELYLVCDEEYRAAIMQHLRQLPGMSPYDAKTHTRALFKRLSIVPEKILPINPELGVTNTFLPHFRLAMRSRIESNPRIARLLIDSGDLPFTHYYFYGTPENPKIIEVEKYPWIITENEELRNNVSIFEGRVLWNS